MESCNGSCNEHDDLNGTVNTIKGQLSILLKLIVILIAGMSFAISQNHKADLKLADVTRDLSSTKEMILVANTLYEDRLFGLEEDYDIIATFCCGELDAI